MLPFNNNNLHEILNLVLSSRQPNNLMANQPQTIPVWGGLQSAIGESNISEGKDKPQKLNQIHPQKERKTVPQPSGKLIG